ncbi:hypothetical protein LCGC14_2926000, partial [marine sediment metagenome]
LKRGKFNSIDAGEHFSEVDRRDVLFQAQIAHGFMRDRSPIERTLYRLDIIGRMGLP